MVWFLPSLPIAIKGNSEKKGWGSVNQKYIENLLETTAETKSFTDLVPDLMFIKHWSPLNSFE